MFKFNTEVVQITQKSDETWTVKTKNGTPKDYDFLILCTGPFNRPYVPDIPGKEKFKGKIIHSSEFKNGKSLCQNKKVVIFGSGKSAFDITGEAYKNNASCTVVMRKAHYLVPIDLKVYGFSFSNLASSRFGFLFNSPHYNESSFINNYFG